MKHHPNLPPQMLPSMAVCERYSINRRTLARWLEDVKLGFPKPAMTINGRHYFSEADLAAFDLECAKRQADAPRRTPHFHSDKAVTKQTEAV